MDEISKGEISKGEMPERELPVPDEEMDVAGRDVDARPHSQNDYRNLNIRALNSGFIVEVGCHTFAIESKESLIDKITQYITNPKATERKWFKGELFGEKSKGLASSDAGLI